MWILKGSFLGVWLSSFGTVAYLYFRIYRRFPGAAVSPEVISRLTMYNPLWWMGVVVSCCARTVHHPLTARHNPLVGCVGGDGDYSGWISRNVPDIGQQEQRRHSKTTKPEVKRSESFQTRD